MIKNSGLDGEPRHMTSGETNMIPLNRSKNSVYRPLLGAALLLCGTGGAAHAQSFSFKDIIDPLNPTFTQALGINNSDTAWGTETRRLSTASPSPSRQSPGISRGSISPAPTVARR
jgi:hypothetical protein